MAVVVVVVAVGRNCYRLMNKLACLSCLWSLMNSFDFVVVLVEQHC